MPEKKPTYYQLNTEKVKAANKEYYRKNKFKLATEPKTFTIRHFPEGINPFVNYPK